MEGWPAKERSTPARRTSVSNSSTGESANEIVAQLGGAVALLEEEAEGVLGHELPATGAALHAQAGVNLESVLLAVRVDELDGDWPFPVRAALAGVGVERLEVGRCP